MDIGALIKEQYEVIEHIGRGGMADVWSARDQRLQRMVAIKTIATGLSAEVDPVALFQKEAQTIAQMEHPHILPIYDFGEYENSLYIVMRYVTGGSLEDDLQDGPLSMDEVLRLADAIAKALDYAHENNIIHLDLKPPNILLDSSASPYLADFGLATVLDKSGRAQNPGSGTLLYMAPEQLTSDVIDHRADIYAFAVMLFHMLTGQLPFEGRTPLAMQQLQAGDVLPFVDELNENVPHEFNEVLRRGTEQDPYNRYATHQELMEALYQIAQPTGVGWSSTRPIPEVELEPYQLETQQVETDDSALLEAVDLYSRARYNWQGGQGRFLLGVTHFMLMSGYYQNAEHYGLDIDLEGYQMLLRGALEYDYELAYWWNQVGDKDRRWVCLHALRSGNAPARIRALYRLETLPDDDAKPVIPRLVAQALEVEVDNTAKMAALKVLGTRAKLVKRPSMKIKTEYRGRLLTSFTRMGIQVTETGAWQEAIYSPEVDTLIAEQAFDVNPQVAEFAARTVGIMRSLEAVNHIAEAQILGRAGALDALAFVRDETPALPDTVSRQARFYAWITNTVRRLTVNPLESILRFVLALFGGALAMGEWIYITFRSEQLFTPQRWGNAIAIGLVFGLFTGLTYAFTGELSRRLQGFWSWWMRLGVFLIVGAIVGILPFAGFTWMYLQFVPVWDVVRFGGFGLVLALVLVSLLRLRAWQSFILTAALTFMPLAYTYRDFYFSGESTIVTIALIGVLLGVFIGWRTSHLSEEARHFSFVHSMQVELLLSVALGVAWTAGIWGIYAIVHRRILAGQGMTWDTVTWILIGSVVSGTVISHGLRNAGRVVFSLVASAAFIGIFLLVGWQFFDYSYSIPMAAGQPAFEIVYANGVPLSPMRDSPLIYLDNHRQVFTLLLPMAIVIALGVNLMPLLEDWWVWIGKQRVPKSRGEWLTGVLIYTLILTGLSSVLALFSLTQDVAWGLGWSAWAFITFIFALATFRWAQWGARGLVASGVAFLAGGFLFDGVNIRYQISQGDVPELLRAFPLDLPFVSWTPVLTALVFWALWSVVVGFFTWGAVRRHLWAGIGLVVMLVGWYAVAIFAPIQGSMTVFAITNVALLLFALLPEYENMEVNRFKMPQFARQALIAAVPAVEDEIKTVRAPLPDLPGSPDLDTAIIADDEIATDKLNKLLAESDVKAAHLDNKVDVDTELILDDEVETDKLNRLLAESDVKAAGFEDAADEDADKDTSVDLDTLNEMLAQSDVNAAGFDEGDTEDVDEEVNIDTMITAQGSHSSSDEAAEDTNAEADSERIYLEDATNIPTEPYPGIHNVSDGNKITTESMPKIKDSEGDDTE